MPCTPCAKGTLVTFQLQLPSAVELPIWEVPSNRFNVHTASAVPVKMGVVTLVTLSVFEKPLSDAAVRSGVEGAAGAVLSMVTERAAEATPVWPAASLAVAVILCTPSAKGLLVTFQ